MLCKRCKKEIPDGSAFCNLCGAAQQKKPYTRKRGNGSGTARKRGNSWTAIWTIGFMRTPEKKLKQVFKTKGGFRTKTDALAYAADQNKEMIRIAPTLQTLWDEWSAADMTELSQSKQTAYKIAKSKLNDIIFTPIDKLRIVDLQGTVDANATTYYPARDMRVLLSQLYKRAMAEEWVHTNLSSFIKIPPLQEKEMQPFSEIELRKLWDAYGSGDHFVGYILLMTYSGMMPGELFIFEKSMIDWDGFKIVGCGLKTEKRKVTPIVFPDIIAPVLRDLCEQSTSKINRVLCMSRDNFYSEYHDALLRCGVRDLPPYSCRHTTATALALGNIAPSVIQEVMRHSKFSTTQRYIHPDTGSTRAAVNTMDKGRKSAAEN